MLVTPGQSGKMRLVSKGDWRAANPASVRLVHRTKLRYVSIGNWRQLKLVSVMPEQFINSRLVSKGNWRSAKLVSVVQVSEQPYKLGVVSRGN
jgi:hypothetical protein